VKRAFGCSSTLNQDLFLGYRLPSVNPSPQNNSCDHGRSGGGLRVGHSEERARIDTDELDEETSDAGENQVGGENFAGPTCGCRNCVRIGRRAGICGSLCAAIGRALTP